MQPGEAVLSVITYGELVYGAEKSQFREQARGQLDELAALLPVMELPMRAGEFYGSIRAALAAESVMIGNNAAERKGDLHVGGAESSSALAEAATIEGL